MNRRQFLKSSAAAFAATTLGGYVAGAADYKKYRVGVIGSGWYGKCDVFRLIQVAPVEVVSISDVDKRMLAEAADLISQRQASKKKPRTYTDYREQLKEKDLDIVIIGTPDHWHALNAIDAMKAGADLYLQKPISVDVVEGQAILAAARKYKKVVQIGTQRRSTPHLIDAIEKVIKPGLLGNIGHVDICCYYHMRAQVEGPPASVPEYLDYDAWCGPAPKRPYQMLPHKRWWRAFMEYGNGIVGDMCVHMLDTVRWMLNLGWPTKISSSGGILVDKANDSNITDTQTANFTFENPQLNVSWTHRTWGAPTDPDYPWALFLYGDKGTLKASTQRYDFIPQGKKEPTMSGTPLYEFEKYPEDKTEKDLERHVASAIRPHMTNLLDCIESRKRPVADVEQGHISTASCILANIAMQLGRTLAWDPHKQQVIGDAQANALLARQYRAPYAHPNPAAI